MGTSNCPMVTNILQTITFYVQQKKKTHTSLEELTEFSVFKINCFNLDLQVQVPELKEKRAKIPIFKTIINTNRTNKQYAPKKVKEHVPFPSMYCTNSSLYELLSSLSSTLKPLMFVISSTSDKSSFSSYILLQIERWTKTTQDEENLPHSVLGYEMLDHLHECHIP